MGARCCHECCHRGPTSTRLPGEEAKAPLNAGLSSAPKRTRTSTRLSRTRPSTWRVYQFRHRRGCGRSIAPGGMPVASVLTPRYCSRTDVRFPAHDLGAEARYGHREGPDEAPTGDLRLHQEVI